MRSVCSWMRWRVGVSVWSKKFCGSAVVGAVSFRVFSALLCGCSNLWLFSSFIAMCVRRVTTGGVVKAGAEFWMDSGV